MIEWNIKNQSCTLHAKKSYYIKCVKMQKGDKQKMNNGPFFAGSNLYRSMMPRLVAG